MMIASELNPTTFSETQIVRYAAAAGFRLMQSVTDLEQHVWKWRRGDDERQPQFLTWREAMFWMYDWLERNGIYR